MLEQERSPILIPTARAMNQTHPLYSPAMRTTGCDIMCLTNTSIVANTLSSTGSLKSSTATIPYEKLKRVVGNKFHGSTPMQQLRASEVKLKRNNELKAERNSYFAQIRKEEQGRKTSTQVPEVDTKDEPIQEKHMKISHTDIYEELCNLQSQISLKPVPGLSLESKGKHSKRKAKMEAAAARRLQLFFKMIVSRHSARLYMSAYANHLRHVSARAVVKFFRLVKLKALTKNLERTRRATCVVKIQCCVRKFLARQK